MKRYILSHLFLFLNVLFLIILSFQADTKNPFLQDSIRGFVRYQYLRSDLNAYDLSQKGNE